MNARQNSAKQRRNTIRRRQLFAERLETRAMLHGGETPSDHGASDFGGDYYLPPQYRLSDPSGFLSAPECRDALSLARSFLSQHATELGLNVDDLQGFRVTDRYTDASSGITHLYLNQTVNGLEVMNANVSISFTAQGEVIFVSSSFVNDTTVVAGTIEQPLVNASQAFMGWSGEVGLDLAAPPEVVQFDAQTPAAATRLDVGDDRLEDVDAKLVYVPTAAGLQLAWRMDVHTPEYTHWFNAYVSAESGEPIYTDSLVENATYNVFAWPTRSPLDGTRSLVVDPQNAVASPYGWHDTNGVAGAEFTDTRGNNVTAQEDVDANDTGGVRPSGGAGLTFDFPLDLSQDPWNSQSAATTNAFYWINLLHDIHYQYGFTEAAGNFQVNNYGRGGLGNDPVIVDVQDGASVGGGGFAALPDGQSPRLTLQRWTSPYRDGAYDSEILIHEFGHGISERLTGGPSNTTALNAVQSKAMGEGWSDWWALMLTQESSDQKLAAYPIGNYVAGYAANGPGVRSYPYSFDKTIDPLTYANFNGGAVNNESHKAGTIWASALWDMNWLLIDKHGFSSDLMNGNGGNNLALRLVMDGLKLQGTNPSFLAGRDAILAADRALTGGANQTEIWTAFARRGMGFSASDGGGAGATTVTEAFDVPGSISGTVYRDDDGSGTKNGGEPGLAGVTVYLDKNNNGIADTSTVVTYNSVDTPKTITDRSTSYSTLNVSGLNGTIADINVTVNLTHPYDGELYLTLISPANTPVIMANYLGGSGDNYTNTTFDDEASTYISAGTAPFTGSFKPYFDFAQLDGRDPNGTWRLRMDDAVLGNVGTLLNWSLQISYGTPDPTAVTDANGNYNFYGLANGTHHVRQVVPAGFSQTAPVSGLNDAVIVNGVSVANQNFGMRAAATVGNVSTLQDTLSPAMVITPPANLGVTHFQISGITNGTLRKNDGTTLINNGDFITVAEGLAGLKFLPSPNSTQTGSFAVAVSANGSSVLANTSLSTGTITVGALGSFQVSKSSVGVSETGTTDTFAVVLTSPPTSNVVLAVTSSDLTEATVSTPTLTFTPANWNVAQTVTVAGVNDFLDDGDIVSNVTIAVVDGSSDDAFDPLADQSVSVTTTDNDAAGFVISESGGSTIVSEALTLDSFTVVLTAQPTSNVVLKVNHTTGPEPDLSPSTLTFTTANWNTPQTVYVRGVDDLLLDGDTVSILSVSVDDPASDNGFDPLPDQFVSVTTLDNEVANAPPTISNIADQAINEDSATAALPFTIGDVETAAGSLVVTATSSNTALVPNANIVIGGSGVNRTVTVTPAANQNGSATITVTVSDGSLIATDTFAVNVAAVNDAPTISDIADQSINEDSATAALPFTVGDLETAAGSLVVTATSSNTALVPNANIVISGSGANRTVTVTPAANQNGSATITVTVSDGSLIATDTFAVNVAAVNDTPTISNIADQSISEDSATVALPFTVGDVETAAGSLVVTATSSNNLLIPVSNIVVGGSGANRTVTVTPAANQFGSTTVTVTVSDGSLIASDSFIINVAAVNDAPTVSDVANVAIAMNSATAALPFVVGDLETAVGSLSVTASSSNTTLVPNANIVLGGSGANRTVTVTPAANLTGSATITLRVSDGTLFATDTFLLTVNSVGAAPVITSLTSPSTECAPSFTSSVIVSGTFTDPDSTAHTVVINWGDGTSSPATVNESTRTFSASRSYSAPGVGGGASSYLVTAAISDGSQQDSKSVSVRRTGAFLNGNVLEVVGTTLRDVVVVRPLTSAPVPKLVVEFFPSPTNTSLAFPYAFDVANVSSIRMDMCAGNDAVTVKELATIPVTIDGGTGADTLTGGAGLATLLGGDGNDILKAGSGGAILVGEAGNDYLYGGSGRDVLIGGAGADYLFGQSVDDILIGGTTSYDRDLAALQAISTKWREPTSLATRTAALDAGIVQGSRTVRLKKTVTVFDDAAVDSVFGSATTNWRLDT